MTIHYGEEQLRDGPKSTKKKVSYDEPNLRFLVAGSIATAITVGKYKEGWTQTGAQTFIDKKKNVIRILSKPEELIGVRNCIIYIGHDFSKRPLEEWLSWQRMFSCRNAGIIYID